MPSWQAIGLNIRADFTLVGKRKKQSGMRIPLYTCKIMFSILPNIGQNLPGSMGLCLIFADLQSEYELETLIASHMYTYIPTWANAINKNRTYVRTYVRHVP